MMSKPRTAREREREWEGGREEDREREGGREKAAAGGGDAKTGRKAVCGARGTRLVTENVAAPSRRDSAAVTDGAACQSAD